MNGNTTIINDPNQKTGEKKFTFDFSYWSHDGYREREDGYLEPVEAKYADQVHCNSIYDQIIYSRFSTFLAKASNSGLASSNSNSMH